MVSADHLDLRATQIGKPRGLGERQPFEFGMRVVDDLDSELDRILGGISGRRCVAGERIDHTDLDGVSRLRRKDEGRREQRGGGQNVTPHNILPKISRREARAHRGGAMLP